MKIKLKVDFFILGIILGIITLFTQAKPVEAFSFSFPQIPNISDLIRLIPFPNIPPFRSLPTIAPLPPLPTLRPLPPFRNPFVSPTATVAPTNTPTPTFTITSTPTITPTLTPTQLPSPTPTLIPTVTSILTPTSTPTNTPSPTLTPISSPTPTNTPMPTLTPTQTLTPAPAFTPTPTPTISPTLTPTPTTASAAGLVVYWKMEEGTGNTVADSSGNGHTLTLNNVDSSVWSDDKPTTTLADTKSLLFDGVNDVASTPDSADLNFASAFTIEVWIKASSTQFSYHDRGIISKWNGGGYMMWIDELGHITNLVNSSTISYNTNLYDDTWHHVAITWDGGKRYVYVDGLLKVSDNFSTVPNIIADPLLIGNYGSVDNNRNFHGNIDEVKIWNVARTVEQIQADGGIIVPSSPTPTPTTTLTPSPTITLQVVLNEFMPKPGNNKDWVEIYNISAVPTNITGWTLADTTGIFATFSATLDAGGFLIATQSSRLNDGGDAIFLRDLENNLVDSKSYTSSEVHKDKSIGRNPDGTGAWKQCAASSAGYSNNSSC